MVFKEKGPWGDAACRLVDGRHITCRGRRAYSPRTGYGRWDSNPHSFLIRGRDSTVELLPYYGRLTEKISILDGWSFPRRRPDSAGAI